MLEKMISFEYRMIMLGYKLGGMRALIAVTDRIRSSSLFLDCLLFVYFITLSGELLHIELGLFKPRVNHVVSFFLFVFVVKTQKKFRYDKDLLWPLLLLFCSIIASAVFGASVIRSLVYGIVYLLTVCFYFILPYNLFYFYNPRRLFKIYFLSFIVLGVYALLQVICSFQGVILPFVSQYAIKIARGQGWNYEPSYYALLMTGFVMYYNAQALIHVDRPIRWIRCAWINLLLLASTSTGIVFSYPVFVALYFCLGVMESTKRYVKDVKKRALQIFCCFLLFMGVLFWSFPKQFTVTFYKFFALGITKHWSVQERWTGIENAFDVFTQHPILGVGIGGVGPYLYSRFDAGAVAVHLQDVEKYDPSNVFSEILASLGLIGACVFCLIVRSYWKVFRQAMDPILMIPIDERRRIIALFLSLLTLMIVLQFNQGLFRSYVWVHAAMVLGYTRMTLLENSKQ